MYTGDGTWYRTVRIKFPVARLFALAENVGLTMSNGRRGLFTVQHPQYTMLYSTAYVFLLFCMMYCAVLYLVYSSTVLSKVYIVRGPFCEKRGKRGTEIPSPVFLPRRDRRFRRGFSEKNGGFDGIPVKMCTQ
jgi:hypothetical protein